MKFLHGRILWNENEFRIRDPFKVPDVGERNNIEFSQVDFDNVVVFAWRRGHCNREPWQVLPPINFKEEVPGSLIDHLVVDVFAEPVLQVIALVKEVVFGLEELETWVQNFLKLALIIDAPRVLCFI